MVFSPRAWVLLGFRTPPERCQSFEAWVETYYITFEIDSRAILLHASILTHSLQETRGCSPSSFVSTRRFKALTPSNRCSGTSPVTPVHQSPSDPPPTGRGVNHNMGSSLVYGHWTRSFANVGVPLWSCGKLDKPSPIVPERGGIEAFPEGGFTPLIER